MSLSSALLNAADHNGTVSWYQAVRFAKSHDWFEEFASEYHELIGERIDAGELLSWAGY